MILSEHELTAVKMKLLEHYAHYEMECEYVEIVDPSSFEPILGKKVLREVAVCVAVYVEGIRLIDNLYLRLV